MLERLPKPVLVMLWRELSRIDYDPVRLAFTCRTLLKFYYSQKYGNSIKSMISTMSYKKCKTCSGKYFTRCCDKCIECVGVGEFNNCYWCKKDICILCEAKKECNCLKCTCCIDCSKLIDHVECINCGERGSRSEILIKIGDKMKCNTCYAVYFNIGRC